jgi:ethanolaminephosphotransferase
LSPFASWCVEKFTPKWLAPNAITTLGLAWMISAYCIVWYWCPHLYEANTDVSNKYEVVVPQWIFLFNCTGMLIYQTLDNMDGKQARRTGSGSALGLLFDHGCDAINSIFGSANWIAAMALIPGCVDDLNGGENVQSVSIVSELFGGDGILAALLILCPMMAFYVSTWEQYYTGKLTLPPFNGPSEGLLLGASLSLISFLWGPMYWQSTSVADSVIKSVGSFEYMQGRVRNLDLIVLASVVGLFREVGEKMFSVARRYGVTSLWTTVPNFLMMASTLVMVHFDPTLLLRRPRTMMHLIAGLFTEQTTQLMLDHIVEENYEVQKRWSLLPQIILAGSMMMGHSFPVEVLDTMLFVYTTGLWVYLVFKIRVQIFEICDVLGIWCFDITTPHPKRQVDVIVDESVKKTN